MPFLVATPTSLTYEDLGAATEAYLVTGYDTAQNPTKRKQAPVITVFSNRTEIWEADAAAPVPGVGNFNLTIGNNFSVYEQRGYLNAILGGAFGELVGDPFENFEGLTENHDLLLLYDEDRSTSSDPIRLFLTIAGTTAIPPVDFFTTLSFTDKDSVVRTVTSAARTGTDTSILTFTRDWWWDFPAVGGSFFNVDEQFEFEIIQ